MASDLWAEPLRRASNNLGNAIAKCWEDIDWDMNRMSIPEPKVEHHEGRGARSCPIFPELRPILDEAFEIFGDKSEYVVAAPQYRAAANTAMGWKNSNLRTEMTRLLRRAGISDWPAVATCRQTVEALLAPPPPLGSGWLVRL